MRIKNNGLVYIITLIIMVTSMISGCGSKTPVETEPEKTVPVKVTLSQTEICPNINLFRER